jgi:hypothetical protein
MVDRGSRWGAVRSVVTNAGYHGNRAGESLQNWPSGHEAVVPQASRTTDARFLAYSPPQSFSREVRRSEHAAEARKIGTSLLFGTRISLVLSGVLRLSAPLMLVRQYRSGN